MRVCFGTGPEGDFYTYKPIHAPWSATGAAFRRVRLRKGWSLRDMVAVINAPIERVSALELGFYCMNRTEWGRFLNTTLCLPLEQA